MRKKVEKEDIRIDDDDVREGEIVLRALMPYNNGNIPGNVGINWKEGTERIVTWEQYRQLMEDNERAFERIK